MRSSDFIPQPSFDGRAVRAFVLQRREFPWFRADMSVPFVDAMAKGPRDTGEMLVYVYGELPAVGGPLSADLKARQHTILEATDPAWTWGTGHVEPRKRWHRWTSWLMQREVDLDDPAWSKRFRTVGADARAILGAGVRAALLSADPATSFAWVGRRVMVQRPGRLEAEVRDRFINEALAVIRGIVA